MGEYTNTRLLRDVLTEAGFRFSTPPNTGTVPGSPDSTTLSFADSGNGSWTVFIFSYRHAANLRFYSYIGQAFGAQPDHILEIINYINATYLFESSIDYFKPANIIRYKAVFRGVGIGLPAFEAQKAIDHHMTCSSYLHELLLLAIRSSEANPELAVNSNIAEVNKKLNLSAPPYFP
ncbi:hypothetical protein WJH60_30715 [Burkholderia orbicola]|uniref:hypothetical protein n=1 Tax=Burkholderia cepacia complex TaxID=87882 RepID=UPI00158CE49A|nr:hypothetical protein [Burkholderia cenocepacia]MBR7956433.1 hypothetical protein [Burkholderia cenocepacia]